jgi:hypothetical protein
MPFFLAQFLLLREAGLHPLSHMAGLFFNMLLVTGIVALPMACLAAVTSNFGKTLLAVLGLILFVGGVMYLGSFLPTSIGSDLSDGEVSFVMAVIVFVAVLLIQYSRRSTTLAWMLLASLAVTFCAIGVAGPQEWAVKMAYPESGAKIGPRLAFTQVAASASPRSSDRADPREVMIVFPVTMAGVAPDAAVRMDDAQVRFTSAVGVRWVSYWQNANAIWLPGESNGDVKLRISRSFYDRMKDTPVTVELSAALTLLKAAHVTRLTLRESRFELPGGSLCRVSGVWGNDLSCLSPMRQPPLMLIATRFTTENCSATPPANDGDAGLAWVGNLGTQPADFGLDVGVGNLRLVWTILLAALSGSTASLPWLATFHCAVQGGVAKSATHCEPATDFEEPCVSRNLKCVPRRRVRGMRVRGMSHPACPFNGPFRLTTRRLLV